MEKASQDVQVHPNQMDARGNDKDACRTVRMVRRMRMHVRLRFLHHPSQVWHDPSQIWYGEKHEPQLKCSERPELHAELVPCNHLWTAAHLLAASRRHLHPPHHHHAIHPLSSSLSGEQRRLAPAPRRISSVFKLMTTISDHDPPSCTKSKENQRERDRKRERERKSLVLVKKDAKRIQSGQGGVDDGINSEACLASELTPTPFIEGFTLPDRDEFVTVRDELDLRVGRFVRASPGSLVEERWYLMEKSEGCPDSENFGGGDRCQRSIRE
ncbi:hypothetical protein F2Q68_00039031 [Brassica cretica]|uniref:Uncharacterized protein n=2 Tax=Brassica cretica TaxID=69181 RepID=A0ABQ7ALL7_BRACR|nr:hypothetical protein F2Q68_00039031 [Brassica cretica]KAF3498581.1 hypothetical protein DY000_02052612 [Brassica cretica]